MWLKIQRVSNQNFGANGSILTKPFPDDVKCGRGDKMGITFGEQAPKIWEGEKTSKIRRDFSQLSTSIVNISGTDRYIANRKSILLTTTRSTLGEKIW